MFFGFVFDVNDYFMDSVFSVAKIFNKETATGKMWAIRININ